VTFDCTCTFVVAVCCIGIKYGEMVHSTNKLHDLEDICLEIGVCVCVCARERERERERVGGWVGGILYFC
jgi:hypothetical protein